jgi:hypothetical protein
MAGEWYSSVAITNIKDLVGREPTHMLGAVSHRAGLGLSLRQARVRAKRRAAPS